MVDAQRALLDQLMGVNRNGDRADLVVTDFLDTRVCRPFLCGLCPHDLFFNTKSDLGPCNKVHDPALRDEYQKAAKEKSFGFENELFRALKYCQNDIDRRIHRQQTRLADSETMPSIDIENSKEVEELTKRIHETMDEAEASGEAGQVEKALELSAVVDQLKVRKADAQSKVFTTATEGPAGGVNEKLRVCEVCGAMLSIFDSERRLADHFGGKVHLGYLQIRKKIEELEKVIDTTDLGRSGGYDNRRGRDRGRRDDRRGREGYDSRRRYDDRRDHRDDRRRGRRDSRERRDRRY